MDDYTPKPREIVLRRDPPATMCVPMPKQQPWRSEDYRRLVALMDCIHCKKGAPSQCAHSDQGKGLGLKSDDRGCYALCADEPGRRGCHTLIGSLGLFTRDQRRALETTYAAATRSRIKADGRWKPEWPEFEQEQAA